MIHIENQSLNREERRKVTKTANRARHLLSSIQYDSQSVVQPILAQYPSLPVICNERCGSWYVPQPDGSCYFKSTDGHNGGNFSLKRLNLHIITTLHKSSACLILDASKTKPLPDSLSRTIPIWCAVLNRIAVRYRRDLGLPDITNWDVDLHTPETLISQEEHDTLSQRIEDHCHVLYHSRAIVDPLWFVTTLQKPLRPTWRTSLQQSQDIDEFVFHIVCVNCSEYHPHPYWKESFWYTPGAADDHELWGRQLIPRLFWEHVNTILDPTHNEDAVDAAMDQIVTANSMQHDIAEASELHPMGDYDTIGQQTGLYIGTRRAGRPPRCWDLFDAILNVTNMEYPDIFPVPDGKVYLQLPVKEGKRDKIELEKWLPVGIAFCISQLQNQRKVLIHCAQGKDRSIALAMAVILFCCELQYPLKLRPDIGRLSLDGLLPDHNPATTGEHDIVYLSSGLSTRLVDTLLDRQGRALLLDWYCAMIPMPIVTKDTIRIVLHLIQQYREKADPSRSTLQKLHRFFMSAAFEK